MGSTKKKSFIFLKKYQHTSKQTINHSSKYITKKNEENVILKKSHFTAKKNNNIISMEHNDFYLS
jgi:hypothetical protein